MKEFKKISAILAAVIISMSSFAVSAEISETTEATTETTQTAPPFTDTPHTFETEKNTQSDNLLGNAGLVDSQQIVFENALISFISVMTRGGNVFYILIDHRIENQEANVYFLNKIDEYDLLSIIYAQENSNTSGEETSAPPEHPYQGGAENATTTVTDENDAVTTDTSNKAKNEEKNEEKKDGKKPAIPTFSIIAIVVLAVGGGGLFLYFKVFGDKSGKISKSVKKEKFDDEDLLEDDYADFDDGE